MLKNILIQPKNLIMIFIVTAAAVVFSSLIELNQSKSEMFELMEEQGHSILETVLTSSQDAITSYNKIEGEIKKRLLNNAETIRFLEERGIINNSLLEKFAAEHNVFRINIFNSSGKKIFSSHKSIHKLNNEKENPQKYLQPIFDGEEDTLIIGLKPARFLDEYRFAVAVATKKRKAIVLNVNAEELLKFRKDVGFGVLLKKLAENPKIIYAALQDEEGIIAGSGKINELESIQTSDILQNSLKDNAYKWRVHKTKGLEVFEVLHPFYNNGKVVGIFRLGISLEPLNRINERLTRRIIIIGILLFIFGSVTFTLIFVRQNFSILSKKFRAIESYSEKVVNNVTDGIVVMDSNKRITLINNAALSIINSSENESKGYPFEKVFPSEACDKLWNSVPGICEIECSLNGLQKIFLFSLSEYFDENKSINYILVFRDLTERRRIEKQAQRNDKMIALGELASSVAHEIRNPLNSIGTITQQIVKDFEVKENADEFKDFTNIVYGEVKRINNIIESFLKYAKPQSVNLEEFSFCNFINDLFKQYLNVLLQKSISYEIDCSLSENVYLDKSQMKQVFINLMENSIDAMPSGGNIKISAAFEKNYLTIVFADNGSGIEPEKVNKIFNLYFTSKKKGSGIGLSIVHKIISDHGGNIFVNSRLNEGTSFSIKFPKISA